ncbi:CMD domain-containing protein [Erwinia amylovora]|uniref:CMD domain-containing protein n=1 Tax=Erwinia amylovora TaxID=552 RepID=UPI001443BD90|nr:oxidoreductase [Erwinia amylovora]
MEQRRITGNNYWYHETQTSLPSQRAPLVPEAATVEDRFLLGLAQIVDQDVKSILRQTHPTLQASRRLYQLLFPAQLATTLSHTLTLYDRLSSALTVAQVAGVQRLCNHYAARLHPLPGPDSSRESNHRLTQITEFVRQLASQPTLINAAALQRLDEVGLSAPDIISLSQVVGFVSYQARVIAGIHALLALPVSWMPGMRVPPDADHRLFSSIKDWQPLVAPVEMRYAAPDQLEAIAHSQPFNDLQVAARLFAHDAKTLSEWSQLLEKLADDSHNPLNALAAAVAARINGSHFCFSRYPAGELREALKVSIQQGLSIADKQQQQVILFAAQLTRSPERVSAVHIQPMKDAGLNLAQIFAVIHSVAVSSWCNRLMQGLGTS